MGGCTSALRSNVDYTVAWDKVPGTDALFIAETLFERLNLL